MIELYQAYTAPLIVVVAVFLLRSLFAFAFIMRAGQAFIERQANEKNAVMRVVWWALSRIWLVLFAVSGITDIITNLIAVTVATIPLSIINELLFERRGTIIDLPRRQNDKWFTAFGETFSYRLGRWVYDTEFDGTLFRYLGRAFAWALKIAEGKDHVAYTYGKIFCPYPALGILIRWKV